MFKKEGLIPGLLLIVNKFILLYFLIDKEY